jgi:VWA domain-containing protein
VVPITQVPAALRETVIEWRNSRAADLLFTHRNDAIIAAVSLISLCAAVLIIRSLTRTKAGRTQVALPAVLDWSGGSRLTALVRHGALILFLVGVPFFILALADPYSSLTREDVSYPGRRIAVMIDASSSMMARFPAAQLNAKAPNEATFFTTVAAAEAFIRQRIGGKYRDLIALVEFGDEAYVVTPFTTDYENILLSLSLVGDWTEFMKFPDQGTTIATAIEQATSLFAAFNFLDASGNLMLLFSDGQDTQVTVHGKHVSEIVAGAVAAKIPVYMVRTSYNKALGAVLPDDIWKPAIESTGGKFYPAGDEATILNAIKDIDRRSAGRVDIKLYSSQRPKFAGYALIAAGFWTLALTLQLTVPYFRKFP